MHAQNVRTALTNTHKHAQVHARLAHIAHGQVLENARTQSTHAQAHISWSSASRRRHPSGSSATCFSRMPSSGRRCPRRTASSTAMRPGCQLESLQWIRASPAAVSCPLRRVRPMLLPAGLPPRRRERPLPRRSCCSPRPCAWPPQPRAAPSRAAVQDGSAPRDSERGADMAGGGGSLTEVSSGWG